MAVSARFKTYTSFYTDCPKNPAHNSTLSSANIFSTLPGNNSYVLRSHNFYAAPATHQLCIRYTESMRSTPEVANLHVKTLPSLKILK